MASIASVKRARRRRTRRYGQVHKPKGTLHPRVQKVGPERFGVVSVDCAKARSKWMLCDFYGRVLVPPTIVTHRKGDFEAAICQLRDAIAEHGLKEVIVAVERTGRYHHPVKAAFSHAGFEVRTVHPFATKQFRQPANPGNKTDDTDLAAIQRAAVNGFALIELPLDQTTGELRLLVRHRRDLVFKTSALCCQIREHFEAAMPGYAACVGNLWDSNIALPMARHTGSAEALRQAGVTGLTRILQQAGIRFQRPTLERLVTWAAAAPSRDHDADVPQRIWIALDDDRIAKSLQIQALERDIPVLLVRTPYVLLLSIPGINVVTAAEFAGEMGPITHYANAKAITGRTGLFPSRYQSDRVDRADGPLVRQANRRLRTAILLIADNLMGCNHHFRALAQLWRTAGKDPRHSHVKVASRFCRIAYQMVAGKQVFRHRCCQARSYILDKLIAFPHQHSTPMEPVMTDLQATIDQLPRSEYHAEAVPLVKQLQDIRVGRSRGPKPIGQILPVVLAKLGVDRIELSPSGDSDPTAPDQAKSR